MVTWTKQPLILESSSSTKQIIPEYVTIINPDGSIVYEPNNRYQQPTIIQRSYAKVKKLTNRYFVEQEGKSYRCCQWCRHWCTRKLPICDFWDRILSCPLLCYLLAGLLLFLLFVGLLTLFGLHPNINSSRRYYGIISILSIDNRTTYIYGLDKLCTKYSGSRSCLNLTTSTAIARYATTIITNQTVSIHNSLSFSLICTCFMTYFFHYRKV